MPTIKLGLDPLGETEFGVIMLFLGILRMGVVTWSVNMHKDTVIYFCWHWPWTWRFLKSHRLQFQLTTAAQGWGHCSYMRTISTLCWYLWATLQAKKPFREEKRGGGGRGAIMPTVCDTWGVLWAPGANTTAEKSSEKIHVAFYLF